MAYVDPQVVSLADQDQAQDFVQDQASDAPPLESPRDISADTTQPGLLTPDQARWYVLNKISSGEANRYNELYGGGSFQSYAQHPHLAIPIPGTDQTSSAAGKYQFIGSTWDSQAKKLGLSDFSPANQDTAAWDLAQTTYKEQTGRNLADDAAKQNVEWNALGNQWTSLKNTKSGASDAGYAAPDNALAMASPMGGNPATPSTSNRFPQAPQGSGMMQNQATRRLMTLMYLKSALNNVQLQRVDYDPWAVIGGKSA